MKFTDIVSNPKAVSKAVWLGLFDVYRTDAYNGSVQQLACVGLCRACDS